jgi:MFS transporter, PAT family, beta-lactamase induction signal transducer AmpG
MREYFNGRRLFVIAVISFASGFPYMLTSKTLQLWFSSNNIASSTVLSLSLIGLPYSLKFLWAPLIDRFSIFGGDRRRSWIIIFQLAMVLLICVIGYFGLENKFECVFKFSLFKHVFFIDFTFRWIILFACLLAFLSASQDVVIDAYRVDYLRQNERPSGASITTFSYRMALLVSLSGLSVLVSVVGWFGAYYVAAFVMFMCLLYTLFFLKPIVTESAPLSLQDAVVQPLKEFLSRKSVWAIIVFILLYRISDNMASIMTVPFLKSYLDFSVNQIGVYSQAPTILGIIIGSFVAGFLIPRMGLYKSLLVFGCLQALSNLSYIVLAVVGKSVPVMVVCFFVEHFFSGMATIAFVTFLMGFCDKRYSATQYSLFTALMSFPRDILGPFMGTFQASYGWIDLYILSIALGLPAIIILVRIGKSYTFSDVAIEKI